MDMKSAIRCTIIFFFQAEDGIRDTSVTGVQTCALPISDLDRLLARRHVLDLGRAAGVRDGEERGRRSEERRVGKECGWRWAPYKSKKKHAIEIMAIAYPTTKIRGIVTGTKCTKQVYRN